MPTTKKAEGGPHKQSLCGGHLRIAAILLALLPCGANAATYTVPFFTGESIQATLNTAAAAGTGNTVYLPPGTYAITAPITLPCTSNLTVTGPVATPATAILSASFTNSDIFEAYSCTGITVEYLQFVNTGGIYFGDSNHSNITITHNQFLGLPSTVTGSGVSGGAIYLDGDLNSTITNFTATWNVFGDLLTTTTPTSCVAVYTTIADEGGNCIGIHAQPGFAINHDIEYNVFNHVEEGVHYAQLLNDSSPAGSNQSVTQNLQIRHNYFLAWHRIAIELQGGLINVGQNVSDNILANPINPSYGTMFISDACCTGGRTFLRSSPPNPANQTNDNVEYADASHIQTVGTFYAPVIGIEYWGGAGTTANNNVFGGGGTGWSNNINYGYNVGSSTYFAQNNYFCNAHAGTYITQEFAGYPPPTQSGNVISSTCAQQTSVAPTISLASGTYQSPQPITLTDAGLNTSIYYTTDGTTPVPGQGTTQLYTGPFSLPLPATLKAVGMWGVAPQPLVHEAPFGYQPSAVVTAVYSTTGTALTLTSVSAACPQSALTVGGSGETCSATAHYSDGSYDDVTTGADKHGYGPAAFTSSNPAAATVAAGGVVTAIAAGSTNISASVGVLTSNSIALTISSSGGAPSLILGQNLNDYAGATYAGSTNDVYYVTGSATGGYMPGNCHIVSKTTAGKHYDCLLLAAPSSTTEATSPTCQGTYTATATTTAAVAVTIPMTGCPSTLAAGSAWWLASITDDPGGPIPMGFYDCGSSGACNSTAPTVGAGTYVGHYLSGLTYGSYSSLASTFTGINPNQPTIWLDLMPAAPTLTGCYQANMNAITTMPRGTSWQQHAYCTYSDSVIQQCDGTADARGDVVTSWGESSGGVVLSVSSSGLVTGIGYGTANSTATVGSTACSPWTWLITNTPATADVYGGMTLGQGIWQ